MRGRIDGNPPHKTPTSHYITMVKKVLDIIPPQKSDFSKESVPEAIEEKLEPEPVKKPKITYVQKKAAPLVLEKNKIKIPSGAVIFSKVAILLAVFGGAFLFLDQKLAKATITIWPETEDLNSEVQITVDTSLKEPDFPNKAIPGAVVTVEKTYSEEFAASGLKNSQNMAGGKVKIYNNFSIPQRLIKGTRLQAPLEKFQPALSKDEAPWFLVLSDVTIPAKSSADVQVVAKGAGEKYNIEPSIFSIPGLVGTPQYTFIYGQSFEKFRGGEKGAVPEVKQADLDSAKENLTKKAETEIKKDLEIMVPENHVLIGETVKIEVLEAASPSLAGANVDKFTFQIKVRASGLIFDKNELDTFGKEHLLSQVQAGLKIYDQSFKEEYSYASPAVLAAVAAKDKTSAILKMTTSARAYRPLDETFVKKGLVEKKVGVAKLFLMNQPKIKDVKIDVSPFWRTSMPKDLEKIQVDMKFE